MELDDYGRSSVNAIRRQTLNFEDQIRSESQAHRPLFVLEQAIHRTLKKSHTEQERYEEMLLLRYTIPRLTSAFLRHYYHYSNREFKLRVRAILELVACLCARNIGRDILEVYDLLSRLFSFRYYSSPSVISAEDRASWQKQRQKESMDIEDSDADPAIFGDSLASFSDFESDGELDDAMTPMLHEEEGERSVMKKLEAREAAPLSDGYCKTEALESVASDGALDEIKDDVNKETNAKKRTLVDDMMQTAESCNHGRNPHSRLKTKLKDGSEGTSSPESQSTMAAAAERANEDFITCPIDHIMRSNKELGESFADFLAVINAFGKAGGFENIINRIQQQDGRKCTAYIIRSLLHAPNKIGWLMSMAPSVEDMSLPSPKMRRAKGKLSDFALEARNATFATLMNMTDKELKGENKTTVREALLSAIQLREKAHMLPESYGNVRSLEAVREAKEAEEFQLQFALKKIKSSFLELRLCGLFELKNKITNALPRQMTTEASRTSTQFPTASRPKSSLKMEVVQEAGHKSSANGDSCRHDAGEMQLEIASHDEMSEGHLTCDVLSKSLIDHGIVEILFDHSRLHVEVIKRSGEVLEFLSSNEVLAPKHIDTVWSATEHTHESIKHAVYSIAVDLPKVLPRRLTEHLWSHIEAIPLNMYDDQTVVLVGSFTMAAMSSWSPPGFTAADRNGTEHENCGDTNGWFGVGILWKIIQGKDSGVNITVFQSAYERLSDYLQRKEFASRREPMLGKCVENVRKHRAMPQSLTLLKTLMETYAPGSGMGDTSEREDVTTVIQWLEQENHLLDLVVDDFVKYCHDLFVAKREGNVDFESVEDGGFWSHANHITERFNFLSYYITLMTLMGRVSLSPSHIDRIWKCAIDEKVSEFECEQAFSWLEKLSQTFRQAAGASLIDYIFDTKLRTMDLVNMTASAGSCFITYFRLLNMQCGNLAFTGIDGQTPVVLGTQLRGMEPLWKVAIDTVKEDVGNKVGSFVVKLYQDLDEHLACEVREKIVEFVDICMRRFGEAVKTLESNEQNLLDTQTLCAARRRVHRCVRLLRMFLDEFEERINKAGGKIALRHGSAAIGRRIRISVVVLSGERFEIVSHSNETLGSLRRKINDHLHASGVRLITAGRELREDGRSLGELRIQDRQTFHVTARAHLMTDFADDDMPNRRPTPIRPLTLLESIAEDFYPSRQLCDEKYFDLFFRMLELESKPNGGTSDVWQLLMRIPTNSSFAKMLKNPRNIFNWEDVLDRKSPFRLFYALQIVQALCQDESELHASHLTESGSDIATGTARGAYVWREDFLKSDGLVHLLSVLMNANFLESRHRDRRRSCLSLLLNLLNRFLICNYRRTDGIGHCNENIYSSVPTLSDAGKQLLSESSLKKVVTKLLDISASLALTEERSSKNNVRSVVSREADDGSSDLVLDPVVDLVVAGVTSSSHALEWFCGSEIYGEWLKSILIGCAGEKRRRAAARSVELLAMSSLESGHILLFRLLGMMDAACSLTIEDSYRCMQYFELSSRLLDLRLRHSSESEMNQIYQNVVRRVIDMPTREMSGIEVEDHVLTGLLDLSSTLISLKQGQKLEIRAFSTAHDSSEKEGDEMGKTACLEKVTSRDENLLYGDKKFVDEIFDHCLFGVPTAEAHGPRSLPKCKTRTSRRAAFGVLSQLCSASKEHFNDITRRLLIVHKRARITQSSVNVNESSSVSTLHDEMDMRNDGIQEAALSSLSCSPLTQWNYSPTALNKSPCGYVGLKNLGTTCYMNSVIQQLFMIPSFRDGILRAPVPSDTNTEPDAILYNLQKLFGYLLLSEKKYFDTREFCSVYRDYDNQPMNTAMQMDVDEFLNMLFDKLERAVKDGPKKGILEENFCGTLVNQVICREVEYISEVQEKFFVLSLEVKDKKSVEESLNFYVQGEILDGDNKYYCEPFKRQVTAVKRTCLGTLPRNLILHLKRFEFDYDQMRKIKVNQSCEFPAQLDMYPYTKEALDRKESLANSDDAPQQLLYNLVGILVHIGTADSGHYYSYIQERSKRAGDEPAWFHFNDMHTEPFDPETIPKNCYGGYEPLNRWDPNIQKNTQHLQPKQHSAYMLFYERCDSSEITGETNMESFTGRCETEMTDGRYCTEASIVPKSIYDEVWRDNEVFFNDKHLFDPDYAEFMRDLTRLSFLSDQGYGLFLAAPQTSIEEKALGLRVIEIGARFIFDALCRSNEKTSLACWGNQMRSLLQTNILGCKWMLDVGGREYSRLFMSDCNVQEARALFQTCIAEAMTVLYPMECKGGYLPEKRGSRISGKGEESVVDDKSFNDRHDLTAKAEGSVNSYIYYLLELLGNLGGPNHLFSEYFDILLVFAKLGYEAREFLLLCNSIDRVLQFYVGNEQNYAKAHHGGDSPRIKRSKTNEVVGPSNVSSMITLLALLVRSTRHDVGRSPPPTLLDKEPICTLHARNSERLVSDRFWINALRDCQDLDALAQITEHLCWEDIESSTGIASVAINGLDKANWNSFRPYQVVLSSLLRISDSLKQERLDDIMIHYMNMLTVNAGFTNATVHGLRFLAKECDRKEHELLGCWLVTNHELWLQRFLLDHEKLLVRKEADRLVRAVAVSFPTLVTPLTKAILASLPNALPVLRSCLDHRTPAMPGAEESLRNSECSGRIGHMISLLLGLLWEEERIRLPRASTQSSTKNRERLAGKTVQGKNLQGGLSSASAQNDQAAGVSQSVSAHAGSVLSENREIGDVVEELYGSSRLRRHVPLLLRLLSAVDMLGIEFDDSKAALIEILEFLCNDRLAAMEMTSAQNRAEKLLSVKLWIQRPTPQSLPWTNKMLYTYFTLLIKAANVNKPFLRVASCHPNVAHLISTTFLEQPYRPSLNQLVTFMSICSQESHSFRLQCIDLTLHKIRTHMALAQKANPIKPPVTHSGRLSASQNSTELHQSKDATTTYDAGASGSTATIRPLSQAHSAPFAQRCLLTLLTSDLDVSRFLEGNGLDLPMSMLLKALSSASSTTTSTQNYCKGSQGLQTNDDATVFVSRALTITEAMFMDCSRAASLIQLCCLLRPQQVSDQIRDVSVLAVACIRVLVSACVRPPVIIDSKRICAIAKSQNAMVNPRIDQCRPLIHCLKLFSKEPAIAESLAVLFLSDFRDVNSASDEVPSAARAHLIQVEGGCNQEGRNGEPGKMSPSTSESREQLARLALDAPAGVDASLQHGTETKMENTVNSFTESSRHTIPQRFFRVFLPGYMAFPDMSAMVVSILLSWIHTRGTEESSPHFQALRYFIPAIILNMLSTRTADFSQASELGNLWLNIYGGNSEVDVLRKLGMAVMRDRVVQVVQCDSGIEFVARLMRDAKGDNEGPGMEELANLWMGLVRGLLRKGTIHLGALGGVLVLAKAGAKKHLQLGDVIKELETLAEGDESIHRKVLELKELCGAQQQDVVMDEQSAEDKTTMKNQDVESTGSA